MSTQRRSRFTATLVSPSGTEVKQVILAPDGAMVRAHYERLGYTVKGVAQGDYRKAAQAAQRPSGAKVMEGVAMDYARRVLGLTLPVEIRYSSRVGGCLGNHAARPVGGRCQVKGGKIYGMDTATGFKHRIMLKSYMSADRMSEVLHHELQHALQFERDALALGLSPRDTLRRWHTSYSDGTAYSRKPYEVEARAAEANHAHTQLAR